MRQTPLSRRDGRIRAAPRGYSAAQRERCESYRGGSRARARRSRQRPEQGLAGLSVASIVLAWSVVHTVYSLRYAELYYKGTAGGVDFNAEGAPCYIDFAYLALTIGMTFQVSDTNLKTTNIRRTALRPALLSYAFGTLIIATTINLVAGLTK